VPVLQNNSGPPLVGLVTIACHLVKESKCPDLLGDSAESRAVVQQWLEHRVTKLDRCRKEDTKIFLKVDLAVQEKEQFANVTRWFDHIQHYPGVRHHLPLITPRGFGLVLSLPIPPFTSTAPPPVLSHSSVSAIQHMVNTKQRPRSTPPGPQCRDPGEKAKEKEREGE
ncbi:unnamed protein product, partial [Tetraodon nigroviridis]